MQPLSALRQCPPRRDPAPSRAAYRMQRLWLTPLFRALMRVGMPAFALAFGVGVYLSDPGRRAALGESWLDMRQAVEQRPEFMVSLLSIDGATPALADAIRGVAALPLPQSSFDMDLEAVRARIETLDAVAQADMRVKSGGVLQVTITEREPAMIWRRADELDLLDATGRRVAMILARADRADLPLIAGEGADKAAGEALQIIAAAGPLLPRLRGLVRMGERRWDMVLDRDQRILLPGADPVRALERIIALDQAEDLLARDILAIDLRNAARPVLRLAPDALRELRRTKGLVTVENTL
ncbi:MAG: cell division protein FtsQ/DivIB [Paracoccaceae bacterium]|nr:cell division protein FtsQ/DivIB [Paracoccaceae bacterium]